jgi:ribosomal protein S15P/S13E
MTPEEINTEAIKEFPYKDYHTISGDLQQEKYREAYIKGALSRENEIAALKAEIERLNEFLKPVIEPINQPQ